MEISLTGSYLNQEIKTELDPDAKKIPATYILTIDPGAETDSFSKYAERAKKRGWEYFELRTGHNLQRTMPEEYAKILLHVVSEKK